MIDFDLLDDLLAVQRELAAREYVAGAKPENALEEWRLEFRRLRLVSPLASEPKYQLDVDSWMLAFEALARNPLAPPDEASQAWMMALSLPTARRLRGDADGIVEKIAGLMGEDSHQTLCARAGVAVTFDARDDARAHLDRALQVDPHLRVHRAMAHLLYMVGDIEGARAHAAALAGSRYRLDGATLEAAAAASAGDFAAEIEALTRAISIAPDGAAAPAFLVGRAQAKAAVDDVAGARADYVRALELAPPEYREQMEPYIRARLDAVDRSGPGARHARLPAFPSVVQKWNYCGPAVLELCLRYVGIPMSQDFIAEAVKEPSGTPMYSLVRFLRDQGIEARRIEATADKVRAAIDLGFPVIVEDDFGNSAHVSVAIGYDDRFGMLIVADPVTHAPRSRSVESRDEFARDLRFGGVLVMGPAASLTPEARAAADAAGLVDAPHIALLDEAARRDRSTDERFRETTPLESAGLAAGALALQPDFPQAVVVRVGSLLAMSFGGVSPQAQRALLEARAQFPGLADLHRMTARWRESQGLAADATAEAAVAVAMEPTNARSRSLLGRMLAQQGERAMAFEQLTRSVAFAPELPDATEALALLLRDELSDRFADREAQSGGKRRFLFPAPTEPLTWSQFSDEALAALTARVSAAACAMAPEASGAALARADVAAIENDLDGALEWLDRASAADPSWAWPWLRRARICAIRGDAAGVEKVVARCLEAAWDWPELWAGLADCLARLGKSDRAGEVARSAIDICADKKPLTRAWFITLKETTRSEGTAARALVALAEERIHDRAFVSGVVDVLRDFSLRGHAVGLLRALVKRNASDAQSCYALAVTLRNTPAFAGEARDLLERALRAAPWATSLCVDLAWSHMPDEPLRALDAIDGAPGRDIRSLEPRRQALIALGRSAAADDVDREMRAIEGSEFAARLAAASSLLSDALPRFVGGTIPEGEPSWGDPMQVATWIRVCAAAGRAAEVVERMGGHRELLRDPGVSRAVYFLSPAEDPELFALAASSLAARSSDPTEGVVFETRARCARGDLRGLVEFASDSPAALAVIAERAGADDVARSALARAIELAPGDRDVLAAQEELSLWAGDLSVAWDAARRLDSDFPFEHQGPERLAELEALAGDRARALDLARTAVSEHYTCGQASATLALALAVNGDWPEALEEALRAERHRQSDDPFRPQELVRAAAQHDDVALQAAFTALRARHPRAPHLGLEAPFRAHARESS